MLNVLCTAAILLCAPEARAQDNTAMPQSYTKIISDENISDTLFKLIQAVAQPRYIYHDSIIVDKLEPSQPVRQLLGLDQPQKEPFMPPDSLEKHGYLQKSLAKYIEELTETTAQKASMESELGVARSIQMSMLPMTWPAFPDRHDLDIFGSVTPAKAVGGDLYDFRIRDGKLFFCIGDVSGKGVPASLVMTVISSMFRTLSASEDSPANIVSTINSSMTARNESLMFVTLFVGALDLASGALQYSNAGHNAPMLVSGGKSRMLDVDANMPVGIVEDMAFSQQSITLPAGTILFLYTDGLTEAARSDGTLFGEKNVLSELSGHPDNISTESLIAHMTEAVGRFVGDAEQSDDLTMLAMGILPQE